MNSKIYLEIHGVFCVENGRSGDVNSIGFLTQKNDVLVLADFLPIFADFCRFLPIFADCFLVSIFRLAISGGRP